ncbi:arsenate reductase ArsC [Massilia sp. NP310]|jgi:arsenate reductase|uniref:arsenate reductase ArsC n=1 Tax=Massilia sp. NP310 TaxID=2861282 RepID=UPI001C63AAA0|nr:arsenate reductase ArsC [Massilia sp. NP310]QYG02775.1 arsenate reductase ArsC [Massilia sp. NP310]
MNILFLCTGNSCRSVLSEGVFNHLAPAGLKAISAGSQPAGQLHPRAVALLHKKGISTEGYYSKSWDDLPVTPDVVVTVCSNAAGETCPAYLGQVIRTHWGLDDPGHVVGTEEEIESAFEQTYDIINARIKAFLSLPLEELKDDRVRFKEELDRIGTIGT